MEKQDSIENDLALGRFAAFSVFILGVIYAAVTILGLTSLESRDDPIGDPYFTIMEFLILLIAPCMVISMAALHVVTHKEKKLWSLTALIFMTLMAGISSGVHFTILTVRPYLDHSQLWVQSVFQFEWPSIVYALDILAWDWFFALGMLFAAPILRGDGLFSIARYLFIVSGVLSLAGLLGVIIGDMQIRNIGIIGYGVIAPAAFLVLSLLFRRLNRHIKA